MDRSQMLWQMTAEQFAAFDIQLYLDTHPADTIALQLLNRYRTNFEEYKKQYVAMFGPLNPEDAVNSEKWDWIDDPWPWEMEAN